MKLLLDDGTTYEIKSVFDVQVSRDVEIRLHLIVDLQPMTSESVLEFAHKVLPGMKT